MYETREANMVEELTTAAAPKEPSIARILAAAQENLNRAYGILGAIIESTTGQDPAYTPNERRPANMFEAAVMLDEATNVLAAELEHLQKALID